MKHPSRFKMTKLKKKDMVEKTQSVFETLSSQLKHTSAPIFKNALKNFSIWMWFYFPYLYYKIG